MLRELNGSYSVIIPLGLTTPAIFSNTFSYPFLFSFYLENVKLGENLGEIMEWFKKHADTIVILGSFALCFWNMNEKFNDKFNAIEKDLTVIKTILIIKNIMPSELAKNPVEETNHG